jgi:hypothetical protein
MTVRGPRCIKGDDRSRWLCVGNRTEQDARKPKRRVRQNAAAVGERRDGVEGAVDQPIRIN